MGGGSKEEVTTRTFVRIRGTPLAMDSSSSSVKLKFLFFSRLFRLIRGNNKKNYKNSGLKGVEKLDGNSRLNGIEKLESCVPIGVTVAKQEEEHVPSSPSVVDSCDLGQIEENCERRLSLRQAVKKLHFGSPEEKCMAAVELQILAKQNVKTRKSLAILGVIPSLIAMLDADESPHCLSALKALVELCSGSYTNKIVIVEAGAVEKLSALINASDTEMQGTVATLLHAISAADVNKQPIGSSTITKSLVNMLESGTEQGKLACLSALYNLSSCLEVVDNLVAQGSVPPLLEMAHCMKTGERALGVLGNVVVTKAGRGALEACKGMPKCLISILGWESNPKCQELAAYILMILTHQNMTQRNTMMQEGIIPMLLELALLGSPICRKRCMRILHCLRGERAAMLHLPSSGPVTDRSWEHQKRGIGSPDNLSEMEQNKSNIKRIVQKSLERNMDLLVKRADCIDPTRKLKTLVNSSSSKSLPY